MTTRNIGNSGLELDRLFLLEVLCLFVDFRSRLLAFRGAGGEPPRRTSACGVSPVPLLPQERAVLHDYASSCPDEACYEALLVDAGTVYLTPSAPINLIQPLGTF
jgi:hypothetical protein